MTRSITIADVAAKAGVAKSTVSFVLNSRKTKVAISEATRRRVLQAIQETGYQPNAAARALSSRRTGHLGFILSDNIADGWANAVFAQALMGVENVCRRYGYGLNISRYNLSNLDTFVVPPKVGQRSVDGLVLTGYVESTVVNRFREYSVPCVCVGDNLETSGEIPTVACDIIGGLFQVVQYVAQMGHRRILYCNEQTPRGHEVGAQLVARAGQCPETSDCRIVLAADFHKGLWNYHDAKPLMDYWSAQPLDQRATVIVSSDQMLVALLAEMDSRGLKCPDDLSLVSSCDSRLCQYAIPPLTSLQYDMQAYGEQAARMLIEHLDEGKPLGSEMSRIEPCRIAERRSVRRISS